MENVLVHVMTNGLVLCHLEGLQKIHIQGILLKAPLLLKSFAIVMFVILTQILEYFVEVVFVLEVVWQGLVGVVGPLEQAEVAVLQVIYGKRQGN
jgi:hypothetical protein